MEEKRLSSPLIEGHNDRVQTGIPSLDRIIEGGLCRGDTIIVAGQPGTGKTTLGLQFLYHGATRCGENGVYASVIESEGKLKRNAKRFGWDLDRLEREGKLQLVPLQSTMKAGVSTALETVLESLHSINARRLVFDSLSALMTAFESQAEARSFLHIMVKFLEGANCTTLMVSEVPWGKRQLGTSFEEFLGDGLIVLDASFDNSRVRRRVYVPKMRGTEHRLEGYDYYITREGFSLAPTPIPPDKIR
ncbi:MAG TPA: ATPase domain-containing protein [Candidatus Bathyarchaeia archaeon]